MNIDQFIETYILLRRLETHILGGNENSEIDLALAQDLLRVFPQFRYEGYAYRAVKGPWHSGYNNVSWSEYQSSTRYAYASVNGGFQDMRHTYLCRVTGFHVSSFVEYIQGEIRFFSDTACTHAREESEILAISYDLDTLEKVEGAA